MTEHVAVNVKGDDNNKKGYYRMHFDVSEMAFIVNFNGDNDKTTDTFLRKNIFKNKANLKYLYPAKHPKNSIMDFIEDIDASIAKKI